MVVAQWRSRRRSLGELPALAPTLISPEPGFRDFC